MEPITLELDNFINPAVGAEVSFHAISWNAGRRQSSIPSGGNLHYHSLPSGGTVEHSHEFGELIFVLSGTIVHRVNGEKQLLEANSLVFVRPNDRHGFLPAPGAPAPGALSGGRKLSCPLVRPAVRPKHKQSTA